MNAAVTRYRILAYVTGVGLLILVFVAMPLKYLAGNPVLVAVVGPAHGILYALYLVVSLDVARRYGWSPKRTVLVLLAGTIPFLSFIAERRVAGWTAASPTPAQDATQSDLSTVE